MQSKGCSLPDMGKKVECLRWNGVNVVHKGVLHLFSLFFFFLHRPLRGMFLLFIFSLLSPELSVFYKVVSVLRSAKPIQSLGGVLWLAFRLKDSPAHSLAPRCVIKISRKAQREQVVGVHFVIWSSLEKWGFRLNSSNSRFFLLCKYYVQPLVISVE